MERKILKWCKAAQEELNCFDSLDNTVNYVIELAKAGLLHIEELSDDRGVVAYMFCPDFRGKHCLMRRYERIGSGNGLYQD